MLKGQRKKVCLWDAGLTLDFRKPSAGWFDILFDTSSLRTTDHRGDGGGCHSKLMVFGPGRADGPADLLEAHGEIIDLQDVPRRVEYCLGVVVYILPENMLPERFSKRQ
jgi:hypothetical protein